MDGFLCSNVAGDIKKLLYSKKQVSPACDACHGCLPPRDSPGLVHVDHHRPIPHPWPFSRHQIHLSQSSLSWPTTSSLRGKLSKFAIQKTSFRQPVEMVS